MLQPAARLMQDFAKGHLDELQGRRDALEIRPGSMSEKVVLLGVTASRGR